MVIVLVAKIVRLTVLKCSVWPAFWSTAPSWPVGGEIDTFEGINNVMNNRMTLHTEPVSLLQYFEAYASDAKGVSRVAHK